MEIWSAIETYSKSGLGGAMGILIPDAISVNFDDGEDEEVYIAPSDLTAESILDLIERSKKAGRNLFREEWELFHEDPDVRY